MMLSISSTEFIGGPVIQQYQKGSSCHNSSSLWNDKDLFGCRLVSMKSASEEWDILCAITFENTPFRRGLFMDCHKEEYVQKKCCPGWNHAGLLDLSRKTFYVY